MNVPLLFMKKEKCCNIRNTNPRVRQWFRAFCNVIRMGELRERLPIALAWPRGKTTWPTQSQISTFLMANRMT